MAAVAAKSLTSSGLFLPEVILSIHRAVATTYKAGIAAIPQVNLPNPLAGRAA
jgi:hypothetical protein